jgi:formate dehydrogenase major subunit
VQVLVTDRVQGKQLYLPLNSTAEPVNRLTGSGIDRDTHTPAYKETAVQMIAMPAQGPSPLPRTNFRFGNPTPQNGVEVERKWQRDDYRLPGTAADDRLVQIENTRL